MNKVFQKFRFSYTKKSTKLIFLRIGILSVALLFMAYGVLRGELPVVLGKAITVCLECIGLG